MAIVQHHDNSINCHLKKVCRIVIIIIMFASSMIQFTKTQNHTVITPWDAMHYYRCLIVLVAKKPTSSE